MALVFGFNYGCLNRIGKLDLAAIASHGGASNRAENNWP
jgi:hypothetical protein